MKKRPGTQLLALLLSGVMLSSTLFPGAWAAPRGGRGSVRPSVTVEEVPPASEEERPPAPAPEEPPPAPPPPGGDGALPPPPPPMPPSGPATVVSVELAQTLAMKVGETRELLATLTMSDGSKYTASSTELPQGISVAWTVDKYPHRVDLKTEPNRLNASVTAKAIAETTEEKETPITVTVTQNGGAGKTATCKVTISPSEPAGVTIIPNTLELAPGKSQQLQATVQPETAPQEVKWSSKKPAIASVDENGVVTAYTAGRTEIVASSTVKEASAVVTVQGIVLAQNEITIHERDSYNLGYEIFGNQLDKTVEWSTDNPNVVRVDNGYIYGITPGEAMVTAKVKNSIYYATCKVIVERNVADIIKVSVESGEPVSFSTVQSQIETQSKNVLGSPLSYISSLTVDTRQGTLYYKYNSDSDTGPGIGTGERFYVNPSIGEMAISNLTFLPKPEFSGTAVINYTGYAGGTKFFHGTIEVKVADLEEISYSVMGNRALQFNVDDFNQMSRRKTGRDLSYVMFSHPDTDKGKLYYNYISAQDPGSPVDPTKQYRRNGSPDLGNIYFVPSGNQGGEVIIAYTGYDVNGDSFRGRVKIRMSEVSQSSDLNYEVSQGGKLTLNDSDFNVLSNRVTGYSLDYVRFEPPHPSEGVLYYNYTSNDIYDSLVDKGRNYYYANSPYIRRITFVANPEFTGNSRMNFTAWDIKGNQFSGTLQISVGRIGTGDIRYSAYENGRVSFNPDDFSRLCRDLTNSSLDYIRFQPPSAVQGTLYYNYKGSGEYDHKITEDRNYYLNKTPSLNLVTFVPAKGFIGTASVTFDGWSISGKRFRGTVEIGVDSGSNIIKYEIDYGGRTTFDERDFNDISRYLTGNPLERIQIGQPSSSEGTLYYDYRDNGYNSKVSSNTYYYRSSSPYIDRIMFIPHENFAGVVSLNYTGWSTKKEKFEGRVEITVKEPRGASVVTYTSSGGPVRFQDQDFVNACASRGLGTLKSIQFTQVSSDAGTLYYQYDSASPGRNTEVSRNTNYYPDVSPRLSEISFVPRPGYQGSVIIPYTGVDSRNNSYRGEIQIVVSGGGQQGSRYFTDMGGYEWAVSAVDYLFQEGIVSGTGNSTYSPQGQISRGDFMLMLYHALDIPDVNSPPFPDVPTNSYYAKAIASARALGITTGYGDGNFYPSAPISRQDAVVFIKRAMEATGWRLNPGNQRLLLGFRDHLDIAEYAKDAMATMIEYGLMSGTSEGYLNPRSSMNRAEMAVVVLQIMRL